MVYKYFCRSENKSVFNWTFCLLLVEKPNCIKIYILTYINPYVYIHECMYIGAVVDTPMLPACYLGAEQPVILPGRLAALTHSSIAQSGHTNLGEGSVQFTSSLELLV